LAEALGLTLVGGGRGAAGPRSSSSDRTPPQIARFRRLGFATGDGARYRPVPPGSARAPTADPFYYYYYDPYYSFMNYLMIDS